MFCRSSTLPLPLGNTNSPIGQANFHSLRMDTRSACSGTVLELLSDLPDVKLTLFQVYVLPLEPPQLGRSQAGHGGGGQYRPPPWLGMAQDGADLGWRRDVHAHLELGAVPLLGMGAAALTTTVSNHIASDQPLIERQGQD